MSRIFSYYQKSDKNICDTYTYTYLGFILLSTLYGNKSYSNQQ